MQTYPGGHAALSGELAALIEDQMKDDTHIISRPNEVSLDALGELFAVSEDGSLIDFTPRDPTPVGAGKHGYTAYVKHGCRCEVCRAASAAQRRAHRARLRKEAA